MTSIVRNGKILKCERVNVLDVRVDVQRGEGVRDALQLFLERVYVIQVDVTVAC
jgi:hypothetical protein